MFERYRRYFSYAVAVLDVLLINLAFAIAYWMRYDRQWFAAVDEANFVPYSAFIPISLTLTVLLLGVRPSAAQQAQRGPDRTRLYEKVKLASLEILVDDRVEGTAVLIDDKGLALTPVLVELATWSDSNLRDIHPSILEGEGMDLLRKDKTAFARMLDQTYREKIASKLST